MKGKLIPFTSLGLVVLNLHFRKKHVPAITVLKKKLSLQTFFFYKRLQNN